MYRTDISLLIVLYDILFQQRYQLSGVRPSTLWMIPLTYTRANNIDFENLRPSVILTGYNMTLPKPAGNEWVLFNTARSGTFIMHLITTIEYLYNQFYGHCQ